MAEERSRHDPCERVLQFFQWDHLRPDLQPIVQECYDTAMLMLDQLPHNQELTLGLRKLVEAKNYFCQARVADQP